MREEYKEYVKDFFVGGTSAGMVTSLFAPLDRVKLLLQVQAASVHIPKEQQYRGMVDAFVRIAKEQGIASYWRGNSANVIRSFSNLSLSFMFKDIYQHIFVEEVDQNKRFWRYLFGNLLSGGAAGASTACFLYPLEFARTRMAADIAKSEKERYYLNIADFFIKTFNATGPLGFYKGFFTSIQGIFIYRAAYFGLFDTAKGMLHDSKHHPTIFATFCAAHLSATTSTLMSYPFDTVRRRMMMQSGLAKHKIIYKSTLECWTKIAKNEGPRGFFRGAIPNMLLCIGSASVLVIFDRIKSFINRN